MKSHLEVSDSNEFEIRSFEIEIVKIWIIAEKCNEKRKKNESKSEEKHLNFGCYSTRHGLGQGPQARDINAGSPCSPPCIVGQIEALDEWSWLAGCTRAFGFTEENFPKSGHLPHWGNFFLLVSDGPWVFRSRFGSWNKPAMNSTHHEL